MTYHHVTVNIADQVAVTSVDEEFHNPNPQVLEGTYIFPLPSGDSGLIEYTYPLNTEKFISCPLKHVSVTIRITGHDPIKSVYCPTIYKTLN